MKSVVFSILLGVVGNEVADFIKLMLKVALTYFAPEYVIKKDSSRKAPDEAADQGSDELGQQLTDK